MEPNIYEELKAELAETKKRRKEINRTLEKIQGQVDRGEKKEQDLTRLMKMRTDESRLQMQLLEKLSKLVSPETPAMQAPTREEWALVRAAILRGEGPAWE